MLQIWLVIASARGGTPQPSFELVPVSVDRPVGQLCFPSGLRVTVTRDESAPVVSVTAVVRSGIADDAPGPAGTNRLLEHLWYRSHPFGKATVLDHLEAEGALVAGYPMLDATAYVAVVASGRRSVCARGATTRRALKRHFTR